MNQKVKVALCVGGAVLAGVGLKKLGKRLFKRTKRIDYESVSGTQKPMDHLISFSEKIPEEDQKQFIIYSMELLKFISSLEEQVVQKEMAEKIIGSALLRNANYEMDNEVDEKEIAWIISAQERFDYLLSAYSRGLSPHASAYLKNASEFVFEYLSGPDIPSENEEVEKVSSSQMH